MNREEFLQAMKCVLINTENAISEQGLVALILPELLYVKTDSVNWEAFRISEVLHEVCANLGWNLVSKYYGEKIGTSNTNEVGLSHNIFIRIITKST